MKRKAIFFFYDEKGIARKYVLFYLRALQSITNDIIFVSNGELSAESYQNVSTIVSSIMIRENSGFDAWALKEAVEAIPQDEYQAIDELIYCNFTAYGPMFSFGDMFEEMNGRNCDFWGAAKHPEQPNYLLPYNQGYIYEHLMSYFWVIRRRMLQSDDFKKFIAGMPPINSKVESVGLLETQFTHHFEQLGYTSDSYVDAAHYRGRCDNMTIFRPNELLAKDRCPLVKRRSFMFPQYESILNISSTNQAHDLIQYIRDHTEYPEGLIWDDLLQTQKMSVLMNNMHLMHILPSEKQTAPLSTSAAARLACIFYVTSKHRAIQIMGFLSVFPENTQIVFVYKDDALALDITDLCADTVLQWQMLRVDSAHSLVFQVLKQCQNVIADTDYCFLMLGEESMQGRLSITSDDTFSYFMNSMVGNGAYLNSLLTLFQSEPFLGMQAPNIPNFAGHYAHDIAYKWGSRISFWENIYKQLELDVPFDTEMNVPLSPVYWVRSHVLKAISQSDSMAVFQQADTMDIAVFFPMLVQAEGFYTSLVTSTKLAEEALVDHSFIKQKLVHQIFTSSKQRTFYANDIVRIVKTKLQSPVSRNRVVNSSHSLVEIVQISKRYVKKKLRAVWGRIFPSVSFSALHARIANIAKEGDRVVIMLISSMNIKLDTCSLLLRGKNYYSLKQPSEKQAVLREHLHGAGQDCAFFELPFDQLKNTSISLRSAENRQMGLGWRVTMSYNAMQLRKYKLHMRIADGRLFCQTKGRLAFSVSRALFYRPQEKLLFMMSLLNPFHFVTLYAENGGAADNAFQLFQYALKKNRFSYFVASKKMIDTQTNPAIKKHMVVSNSRKHIILTLFSKLYVTSWTLFLEALPRNTILKDIHYAILPFQWVCSPHGITVGDKLVPFVIKQNWEQPDMLCANSENEKAAFVNLYGFGNVIYQGSPRMDKWFDAEINERKIVVFFTWRIDMRGKTGVSFADTAYCRIIVSAMTALRRAYTDYNIHYVFHHEVVRAKADSVLRKMMKELELDYINLSKADGVAAFNNCMRSAKYLITDFSSVAYDFAYKEGAVPVYYLPEGFVGGHYELMPCFYDMHVGLIASNEEQLISAILLKQPTEEMQVRRERFFGYIDNNNAKRVYQAIRTRKYLLNAAGAPDSTENGLPAKRRLAIFFFYDADGIVDDYIPVYLDGLKTICQRVHVVVNGLLSEAGEKALRLHCDDLLVRENVGFDSWAYKAAIEQVGYEEIHNAYDELVLCNFTMYGPIFPFSEMVREMDRRTCDFWGHNRYQGNQAMIGNTRIGDHLQSYFMVFRKPILSSHSFQRYWDTLSMPMGYRDAISCHELRCTAYFERLGFISDAYMPFQKYCKIGRHNTPVNMAYTQLVADRSPLLKRKVLFIEDCKFAFDYSDRHSQYALIRWIRRHTQYDASLIWRNLERTLPLSEGDDSPEKWKEYRRVSRRAFAARFSGRKEEEKWLRKKNEFYFPKRFKKAFKR